VVRYHVFQSCLGHILAAERSLEAIGAFLAGRLDAAADINPATPPQLKGA
jgi:hypothetical protein